MSKKKEEKIEPVKTKMLDSEGLKEFNRKTTIMKKINSFLLIVVSILLFGSVYLNFLQYIKLRDKKYPECPVCKDTVIETKKVNIEGFIFDLDNNWKIDLGEEKLSFTNKDESIFVSLKTNDFSYGKLNDQEFLKKYLEKFQIDENCFIKTNREEEKDGIKYYYLEGTQNGYPFITVLYGNEDKTFSANASFENETALESNKQSIIDLLIKAYKNNE